MSEANARCPSGAHLIPWTAQEDVQAPSVARGSGSFFWDDEGRRYLDLTSGFVAASLGHGHPKVVEAIRSQALVLCSAPATYRSALRERYAEALSRISPWPCARVHFASGGGEANDDAIKIARQVTGRPKILAAYRSYHGATLGASGLTGIDRWRDPFPTLPGVARFFAPYPYRSPFHAADAAEETARALHHLEQILSHEGASNVAALIIEPVTGSSGLVAHEPAYLAGLRALCDRYGMLLVFDEVMTGFGRVGAAFAAVRLGVTPDLITFAKGASGSYAPLGGVLVREEIARHFDDALFDVGHTYSGHILAMAAGLAALAAYEEEGLFERALEIEAWLRADLDELQARHPVVGDVRGLGALFALELVRDRATREPLAAWHDPGGSAPMRRFWAALLRRGVHGYGRYNLALVAPPLNISRAELRMGVEALDGALSEVEAGL